MDIVSFVSSIAALIGAAVGIYIARSTRRKNEGDAALAITQAAEKVVQLREKDISDKDNKIKEMSEKLEKLERYVDYLHDWIDEHVDGTAHPKSYSEFRK